jgi:type 1 glutamine amidotransferase
MSIPGGTFDAPIIVEDSTFPGMEQWPKSFVLRDEIYQMRNYSREKVRVLMRLDASKIDLGNKNVHRTDRDFAVTWVKTYGKGRVFYTTLGHVRDNWDKPEVQKMMGSERESGKTCILRDFLRSAHFGRGWLGNVKVNSLKIEALRCGNEAPRAD